MTVHVLKKVFILRPVCNLMNKLNKRFAHFPHTFFGFNGKLKFFDINGTNNLM